MEYVEIQEIAKKWALSERSVQMLCARGRIKEVNITKACLASIAAL